MQVHLTGNEFIEPRTEEEQKVAGIWKEVLNVERVGINDNFFELGGDSIKVIRVVHRLRKAFQKEIKVFDLYNTSTLAELITHIENTHVLESRRNEILQKVENEIALLGETMLPLLPDSERIEDVYPMSDIQNGMIFASLLNPELAIYHDQMVYELSKKIDFDVFVKALSMMVRKHNTLRTGFNLDIHSEGLQIVYKEVPVRVDVKEMPDATEEEAREFIKEFLKKERGRPFDVTKAPLWRANLINLKNQTVFLFQCHHAILDGWSVASFSTELNNLYLNLLTEPEQTILPLLNCTIKDFVTESMAEKKNDENKAFWINEMSDYKRLDVFTQEPVNERFIKTYSKDFLDVLIQRTKKDGLTLKGLFFGAYMYSLSLLTYEDELTAGLVTNIRPLKEDGDKVLGCFLNTVPFRFKKEQKSLTWQNYFEHIEKKMMALKQRDRTTLHEIVKITAEKSSNENPFFDTVFNFVNFHVLEGMEKGLAEFNQIEVSKDNSVKDESLGFAFTNTYLDCTARITGDIFDLNLSIRKNLKSGKSLEDLTEYFERVIECYLENYGKVISTGDIIPAQELDRMLIDFNKTEVIYPKDRTVIDLFEEQVLKNPDNTAVVFGDEQLTYRQLNERSNRLARYLQGKGVKKEMPVPVCIERSIEIITAMLGILKAGGAYVPVDPEYPEERIKFILEDTAGLIIISSKESKNKLPASEDLVVIEIDGDRSAINKQSDENLQTSVESNNLVYVIYTSGSTGKPKGVMIEHKGLVNLIEWHNREYKVSSMSRATQMAGTGFDAFGWEVWPYLSAGATLFIVDDSKRLSPCELTEFFNINGITHSFISTALADEFVNVSRGNLTSLEYLLTGGDKLSAVDTEELRYNVINNYGPTENTVVTTNYELSKKNNYASPPIGKPISNTLIYIVNRHSQLMPLGTAGEICITGAGLARGYINHPDLTSAKFISNAFIDEPAVSMYKTGDLGRWLSDGNIEYLGRIDEQVKIRGYRIELGEIESVLQESRLVNQSVVIAKEDEQGNKRLVAYIVEDAFDKEAAVSYLRDRLPEYMVPALWVELESLPLTSNGKIDKKALPDPNASELLRNEYVAPRNETEEKLATIWKDLLRVERVGINDNFFELGGDSIITIQVVSRARRLGFELKPKDIFIHQTIGSLSASMSERPSAAVMGEQGLLTGRSGLLPIQQWYFEGAGNSKSVSHFNQSVLLSIDKSITPEILNKAVEELTSHHDALRFRYNKNNYGQWQQEYETGTGELITVDLKPTKKNTLAELIKEHSDKYQRSLDIEKGEIARFVLMQTPEKETYNRILIVIHHLAVDGVSWRILLDDLEQFLTGFTNKEKSEPGLKSSSYRQWYDALKEYGQSKKVQSQVPYWEEIENSYEVLPTDKEFKGEVTIKDIANHSIRIDPKQTQLLLQEVPRVYHSEINDMLLCALALTLCEFGEREKITIGLEGHGRENINDDIDTSRTVGWFTNLYPVLLKLNKNRDFSDSIKSVKEQLRNIPDKGLGYGVLRYINKEERLPGKHWDIVFNYLGQLDNVVSSGKWLSGAGADESKGSSSSDDIRADYHLSVNSMVQAGELILNWGYSVKHYKKSTIENLTRRYKSILESLISHCIELEKKQGVVYTPSDYGLGAEISYSELDRFLDEPFKTKQRRDYMEGIYRLSGLQEGMLFHALYDTRAGAYTEQLSCDLIDPDLEIISRSWNYVLSRHSILRSGFYHDEFSIPVQCVYREAELPVAITDYREMNEEEQSEAVKYYTESDRMKGFDFKTAPLMRISLLRLTEDKYRMIWTSHHILFDGWSMPVLMEEFLGTYELLISGKEPERAEEDCYEDYIRYIERGNKDKQEKYWREYMKGVEQNTLLPFITTTAQRTKGIGEYASEYLQLDKEKTAQIESYAQRHHITVNTLMQGVWSYLLHRYTGNDEVVYGIIVSGRPDDLPGIEKRVGMYINTLPLHSTMQGIHQMTKWLRDQQSKQVSSAQFQYTSIKEIQELTGVQGDLFDSILVFENYPLSEIVALKDWKLKVENIQIEEQTNYPLTLLVSVAQELKINFSFNTEVLKPEYMREIRTHFENVLMQIISNGNVSLNEIELLTKDEKYQLLNEFNDTAADYPKDRTIIDLFEVQAAKTPDAVALVFEDAQLTYKQLNERSNQLAHYLTSKGVKEGTTVPICIERGIIMITGVLGILKAGAAYVPVDPDYPEERISFILEDNKAEVALSSRQNSSKLTEVKNIDVVEVDAHWVDISKQPIDDLKRNAASDDLAYVIYTSGSTGQPKGVRMPDSGLVNLMMWQEKQFVNKQRRVLQFASLNFDVSFQEIFSTLCFGSTLHLINSDRRIDMTEVLKDIKKHKITHLFIPYVVLKNLAEYISQSGYTSLQLEEIITAGEQLRITEDVKALMKNGNIRLINQYGPTEAHVVSSYEVEDYTEQLPPIGKPIDNTLIYILDSKSQLTPIGVKGELHIGGVQVALGYLNRPELTKEKFVKNMFSKEPEAMMYKTGDLARWLPDGNIEYIGRGDDQVKIRGYRIELGEIESVLLQSGLVSEAAVLAREDNEGNKRLTGYVVSKGNFDKEKMVSYLQSRLPDYMVPSIWVGLESMPLNQNGKTDKRALPDPDVTELLSNEYVAPGNDTEKKLAEIWQQLLGTERIGIHDNFFELGGHSLHAIRLISAVRKKLEVEIHIGSVFEHNTVESLAGYIQKQNKGSSLPQISVQHRPERIPLSFSQERLWFIDRLEGSVQYHLPSVLRLKGKLNKKALAFALQNIVNRHEVLRTVIAEEEGKAFQLIKEKDLCELYQVDGSKYKEDPEGLRAYVRELVTAPFDISKDHMLRTHLIKISDDEHLLVVTQHHIASDGWSTSIIVKELAELYKAFEENREAELSELKIQYADYALWQRNYLQGKALEKKLEYWKNKLEGAEPLQLPTDYSRPSVQSVNGAVADFKLDKELSDQLQELSRQNGTTLFMTLLAVFNILLYRYSRQRDVCVGSPVAGRQQAEVEELIGFFINTLCLRNDIRGDVPFTSLLQQVRTTTLEAYENQEAPFEKVVEEVSVQRDMSRSPLFQVMLVLQNTPEVPELNLGELNLSKEPFALNISKFDLSFFMTETPEGLYGSAEYCTDLYNEATIRKMIRHFNELLRSVVKNPDQKVGLLPMLSQPEAHQLLIEFNETYADQSADTTVVDLFEEQALKTPDNAAVVFGDESLTYKELNERSNQLAHYLRSRGVRSGTLVPVCIERCIDMLISIFGILKAGGAYVPIDPEYPEERISYILDDTGASIAVTSNENKLRLPVRENIEVIKTDGDRSKISKHPLDNVRGVIEPYQPAYVIYTSGSTGKPKGVMIGHDNLVSYLLNNKTRYITKKSDNSGSFLHLSYTFDASITGMFMPLLSGKTVVIASKQSLEVFEDENLKKYAPYDFIKITPAHIELLQTKLKTGDGKMLTDKLVIGGEALLRSQLDYLTENGIDVNVVNEYGPTEATVGCSVYSFNTINSGVNKEDRSNSNNISIGKPIDNVQMYILSEDKEPVPVGVAGEIHISGLGLAKGYLNQPELTAEKFITNPFTKEVSGRIYRTGDLGRWLPDGNIEYLGRTDEQVKIRGYRLEPGEIESVLNECELVRQALVLAREDKKGNRRLTGYVVPNGVFDKDALMSYLRKRLPEYMVPALWSELESFPLTKNGKIDRRALPEPDVNILTGTEHTAPTNEIEEELASIWKEFLHLETRRNQ